MASSSFYEILESEIPGGSKDSLDTEVLHDRKLYLTRISMDHLEDMYEYSQDDRLYRCFEYSPHQKLEDTRDYLKKLIDRVGEVKIGRKNMYWFVHSLPTQKVIGTIGLLDIDIQRDSAAWGYGISPKRWGEGLILEAQLIVIKYFFEKLQMNRLYGVTAVDNDAVLASVTAAGCQREGVLREYYKYPGSIRKDAVIYSLLARDYFESKEKKTFQSDGCFTLNDLKQVASSVFKISPENINPKTQMSDIPHWDSLTHISFLFAIEKRLGIKFKPSEIARAVSVESILKIINATNS